MTARNKKKKPSIHSQITGSLRQIWLRCDARKEALARCKVRGIGNGHLCEWCGQLTVKPEVDHMTPVGVAPGSRNWTDETWDGYIARLLYVRPEELQVLCRECHLIKTEEDRNR